MISRKKILSRSRDSLNEIADEAEDIWYNEDKLIKDHIQEVLKKWSNIDDEIWSKVVVFEKNRRVAKAYARAPVLTINGSNSGFDGYRIGLCGFDNPYRDKRTDECLRHIAQGAKIKMDETGNILIKRLSASNVYVKKIGNDTESAIGNDLLKLNHGAVQSNKPVKVFDMSKFKSNIAGELKRAYPNRRRLESQCVTAIVFVKNDSKLLRCPLWILVINVVAIDMLKAKFNLETDPYAKIRPPLSIPLQEEDNYSVMPSKSINAEYSSSGISVDRSTNENAQLSDTYQSSSQIQSANQSLINQSSQSTSSSQPIYQSRGDKPPKLPPRSKLEHCHIPQPDYDEKSQVNHSNNEVESRQEMRMADSSIKRIPSKYKKKKKIKEKDIPDDPYYCGLLARIPNFVAKKKVKTQPPPPSKRTFKQSSEPPQPSQTQAIHIRRPSVIEQHVRRISVVKAPAENVYFSPSNSKAPWYTKSLESGLDSPLMYAPYNHMFYQKVLKGYPPMQPGTVYIGEWD